ncbi:MAG: DNA-3-methyladenine glycosylase I [Proteobacteria bacterium]|nr:DNA-3-methyladenine glycosylase I [Pseudomonadota bacterium]
MTKRCEWCLSNDLMIAYHDEEWGVPVHDDRKLFEFMVLDAFQAGLSWSTILNKRENFRAALDDFDPQKIAKYKKRKIDQLLGNAGIIRNRQKISATINNAQIFLEIQSEFGTFDTYIWKLAGGRAKQNRFKTLSQIPPNTEQSDVMSKELKKRGFKFVGSTICYAFMQAAGMVNDHETTCFRYKEIKKLGA